VKMRISNQRQTRPQRQLQNASVKTDSRKHETYEYRQWRRLWPWEIWVRDKIRKVMRSISTRIISDTEMLVKECEPEI